jgi:hypothetical protein
MSRTAIWSRDGEPLAAYIICFWHDTVRSRVRSGAALRMIVGRDYLSEGHADAGGWLAARSWFAIQRWQRKGRGPRSAAEALQAGSASSACRYADPIRSG